MNNLPVLSDQTTPSPVITEIVPADRHPVSVYIARLSHGSRRTMGEALASIAGLLSDGVSDAYGLPWHALRYQHTQAVRTALAGRYAPSTANKMLSALRGALKECYRLDLMSSDDYQRAVDLEPVRGSREARGRSLSAGELRALFEVCAHDKSPAGARDAALLALAYAGGLRRSELVGLDREDFDVATGALRLVGKGNKERTTYLNNGSLEAMKGWLQLRGDEPGPLFYRIGKGGIIEAARFTDQALLLIFRKRAREAKINRFSPHDMRRSFISDLLDAGADIAVVSRMAGHSQVTTTARYDRRGEESKRKAAALLHVPYSQPRQQAE